MNKNCIRASMVLLIISICTTNFACWEFLRGRRQQQRVADQRAAGYRQSSAPERWRGEDAPGIRPTEAFQTELAAPRRPGITVINYGGIVQVGSQFISPRQTVVSQFRSGGHHKRPKEEGAFTILVKNG